MSNYVIRSYHESKESEGQSRRPYQNVWMAHWNRTSIETSLVHEKIDDKYFPVIKRHLPYLSGPDAATDASNCASKEFTEVPVAGAANAPDESMTGFSQFSTRQRLQHGRPFQMLGLSQNRDKSILTVKDDGASFFYGQAVGPQLHPESGLAASPGDLMKRGKMSVWGSSSGYESRPRERLRNLEDTSHDAVGKSSLVVSASFKNDFFATSSRSPIELSSGRLEKVKGPCSFVTATGRLLNGSFSEMKSDQRNHRCSSSVFVHKLDNDHLMSKTQLTVLFGNNEYQKDHFATGFLHGQTSPFEVAEAECSSRPRSSFIDVETMKICTTIDSVEGLEFRQTTKELFFTERRTNASSSRGGAKIFRESTMSTTTQLKGKCSKFKEVSRLSSGGGFNSHQQGVKLQPLWSSTDSEENDEAIYLKNESSAETNTLDIDALKEDNPYGEAVSLSNKDFLGFPTLLAACPAAGFTSEVGRGKENADLPSSSRNHLALPLAIASSTDDKEPSMSKTQSLDVVYLIHGDDGYMATNSKSRSRSTQSEPDMGSRRPKRLKSSTTESLVAHGSKISKLQETTSPPGMISTFPGKMKQAVSSSEPLISKSSCEKNPSQSDQNDQFLTKHGGSNSTSESMGKSRAELLSHVWIKRWCRNQSPVRKKPEGGDGTEFMFCEPQSLKVSLDEIQKKQFPSIAAMALMGKAMKGFHPCEFKNRGSFVVWNSK